MYLASMLKRRSTFQSCNKGIFFVFYYGVNSKNVIIRIRSGEVPHNMGMRR